MRPTATDVTRIMQDMYLQQSLATSIAIAPDGQTKTGRHLRDGLMSKIQRARGLNPAGTRKPLEITPDLKSDNAEFCNFYLEDDDWDSVKSYLVGAAIFWGVADLPALGICPASGASSASDLETLKGRTPSEINQTHSKNSQ
jgi:hypothetical protein